MPTVSLISTTPVKSLGLLHPDEVELAEQGVAENRRLYLVDGAGRLFGGTRHGAARARAAGRRARPGGLALTFPDGSVVVGEVALAEPIETDFFGRPVRGRVVEGPWADALSAYAGAELRLVRTERPGDGSDVHVATVASEASCEELARHAGAAVDPSRFRMLFTLAGCAAHEEDTWTGRRMRIGGAVFRIGGPVPRCVVTTQDPATGRSDLDTLRTIGEYRGRRGSGGPSATEQALGDRARRHFAVVRAPRSPFRARASRHAT